MSVLSATGRPRPSGPAAAGATLRTRVERMHFFRGVPCRDRAEGACRLPPEEPGGEPGGSTSVTGNV